MLKRRLLILLIVICACVVVLEYLNWTSLPFDRQSWKAADGRPSQLGSRGPTRDNRRARMESDLVAHHLRLGSTQAQVERIVGEPGCGGGSGSSRWEYYPLLAFPWPDQRAAAWFRWRTIDPYLTLHYTDLKLDRIEAGRADFRAD